MSEIWFTADLHLGHEMVAGLRGFSDVIDHDEAIYDRWRERVEDGDHVWVLGDVFFGRRTMHEGFGGLPGIKHLIAGNHDTLHPLHRGNHRHFGEYLELFDTVQTMAHRKISGYDFLLSHFNYEMDSPYPEGGDRYAQWRLPDLGGWLLHGHSHSPYKVSVGRQIHVGVDAWGLSPVSEAEVMAVYKRLNDDPAFRSNASVTHIDVEGGSHG